MIEALAREIEPALMPLPSFIEMVQTMMLAQCLNTLGLSLGMLGVVLIFIWGPPQPSFEGGVPLIVSIGTVLRDGTRVADLEEDAKRRKRRHRVMSSLGLVLVFCICSSALGGLGWALKAPPVPPPYPDHSL